MFVEGLNAGGSELWGKAFPAEQTACAQALRLEPG